MFFVVFLVTGFTLASSQENHKPLTRLHLENLARGYDISNVIEKWSALNSFTKEHNINGKYLKDECLDFIQKNNVSICFEAIDPETGETFANFNAQDRVQSYKQGLKRLKKLIQRNGDKNEQLFEDDDQLSAYVFKRRDLPILRSSVVAAGMAQILGGTMLLLTEMEHLLQDGNYSL